MADSSASASVSVEAAGGVLLRDPRTGAAQGAALTGHEGPVRCRVQPDQSPDRLVRSGIPLRGLQATGRGNHPGELWVEDVAVCARW